MDAPARPAIVRPRVRVPGSLDGTWLLDDAIDERLAREPSGALWIAGARGSGLRTARTHLEARYAGHPQVLVDPQSLIGDAPTRGKPAEERLRLRFCRRPGHLGTALELAPWTRDEAIEYLLARHPQQCARAMQRFEHGEEWLDLGGMPLVLAAVLDELAADFELSGPFAALRAALARQFDEGASLARARAVALEQRRGVDWSDPEVRGLLHWADWLDQEPVRLLLGAEAIVLLLEKGKGSELPTMRVQLDLLRTVRPLYLR